MLKGVFNHICNVILHTDLCGYSYKALLGVIFDHNFTRRPVWGSRWLTAAKTRCDFYFLISSTNWQQNYRQIAATNIKHGTFAADERGGANCGRPERFCLHLAHGNVPNNNHHHHHHNHNIQQRVFGGWSRGVVGAGAAGQLEPAGKGGGQRDGGGRRVLRWSSMVLVFKWSCADWTFKDWNLHLLGHSDMLIVLEYKK